MGICPFENIRARANGHDRAQHYPDGRSSDAPLSLLSLLNVLYVSDVLWRISDILYPFDSKELPENYFFYGLVMFQGQCEQVHNNTKNSVFYFFQPTQQ